MVLNYTIGEINMIYPIWVKIMLHPMGPKPVKYLWLPLDAFKLEKVTGYILPESYEFQGTVYYKEYITKKLIRIKSPIHFFNTGESFSSETKRLTHSNKPAKEDKTNKHFTLLEVGNIGALAFNVVRSTKVTPIDSVELEGINDNPVIILNFNDSDFNIKLTSAEIEIFTSK